MKYHRFIEVFASTNQTECTGFWVVAQMIWCADEEIGPHLGKKFKYCRQITSLKSVMFRRLTCGGEYVPLVMSVDDDIPAGSVVIWQGIAKLRQREQRRNGGGGRGKPEVIQRRHCDPTLLRFLRLLAR